MWARPNDFADISTRTQLKSERVIFLKIFNIFFLIKKSKLNFLNFVKNVIFSFIEILFNFI
jgi:hypothetical protein